MLFLLALLFAPNLTVLAPGGGVGENAMALSGGRIVVAAMQRNASRAIAIFVSTDSGTTWASAPEREMSVGGKTYAFAWDPWLTVLDDGSFGLTYELSAENAPALGDIAIVYTRSTDGITWSPPVLIDSSSLPNLVDKPTATFDRAHAIVCLSWTRLIPIAGNNNSYLTSQVLASSNDRGATWQTHVVTNNTHDGFPQTAVTADGTIVYTTGDRGQQAYLARVSTDGGATFSDPQVIGRGNLSYSVPFGAFASWMQNVAARGNDVYCIYPVREGVFFTRSNDRGQTWSAPLYLAGKLGSAVRPTVAVDDATGNIIVTWIDSNEDPAGLLYRLYAAQSDDGGATFSTPAAFSPPFAVGPDIGDFNSSVVFRKGSALAAFAPGGGYLTAARIVLTPPPPRRRAVRH